MLLKDLRTVVGEQVKTNVRVNSGYDNVVSGDLWLFTVDDSIDNLEVKDVQPHDNVLEVTLQCDPKVFKDTDWPNVFNKNEITSYNSGPDATDVLVENDEN